MSVGTALGIVAGAMFVGDRAGWIAHRRMATVYATANCGAGKEKSCQLHGGMQAPTLVCDEGWAAEREPVEFRGPLHAADWRCERDSGWVECKAK